MTGEELQIFVQMKKNFEEKNRPAYGTKSSLGKAVSKASKSLPMSPRKTRAVVGQLARKVGLIESNIKPKRVLSDEVKEKVRLSYYHADISRQAPGKRDYVTLWKKSGKVKNSIFTAPLKKPFIIPA